jgi:hypothetical protein
MLCTTITFAKTIFPPPDHVEATCCPFYRASHRGRLIWSWDPQEGPEGPFLVPGFPMGLEPAVVPPLQKAVKRNGFLRDLMELFSRRVNLSSSNILI